MSSKLTTLGAIGVCLLVASTAWAQAADVESRVLARRMADEGATQYEAGKFDEARELFHRANSLYPAPALEFWEARALNKLGRLVEAEERYASVKRYKIRSEDSDVVRAAVAEAAIEVDNLRKRIPTITIQLRGANVNDPAFLVQLSGKALNPALIGLPIPTDPSTQTVRLLSKGVELRREVVLLKEGERKILELDGATPSPMLAQSAPVTIASSVATASPGAHIGPDGSGTSMQPWYARRDVGWAITGFGAASFAVGVATGVIAVGKHDALVDDCPNNACRPAYESELSSYHSYRTVSTIGYVVGAIGLGTGITILLTSPKSSNATLAFQVGPGSTAMGVRY